MTVLDKTLNRMSNMSTSLWSYDDKIKEILATVAINTAIMCDKLDEISKQLKERDNS